MAKQWWKTKKWQNKWSKSRRPLRKTLNRKADKRFNWVTVYNDICSNLELSPHACVEEGEFSEIEGNAELNCQGETLGRALPSAIELIPPADVPAMGSGHYENDDITLVRMVGSITLQPVWVFTEEAAGVVSGIPAGQLRDILIANLETGKAYVLRAGLAKDRYESFYDDTLADYLYRAPTRDPLSDADYSDGHFMKMWQRNKYPYVYDQTFAYGAAGALLGSPGCCPNVHGGASATANGIAWGVAEGSIDTLIETDCEPCGESALSQDDFAGASTFTLHKERPIRINLTMKRRLRFRENEGLNLWLNWASFATQHECLQLPERPAFGVGWIVKRYLKVLIET